MKKIVAANPSTHAGEIVEIAVRKTEISISELSRRMHVNRRSVYNWFQQRMLKIEIISEIGVIIGHDFSKDFPAAFEQWSAARMIITGDEKYDAPGFNDVHFWMNKYIILLEKYNGLLEAGNRERSIKNPVVTATSYLFKKM